MEFSRVYLRSQTRRYFHEFGVLKRNNKNYALAVSINEDDTDKMNVVVLEYYFENGQIMVNEIADDSIAKTVTELLQKKLQSNE